MKLYFASTSVHKKQELEHELSPFTLTIPLEEGIPFDVEETGESFLENSLLKARALWEKVRCPVIADDSGLCVDVLGGAPGVYSARYAGREFRRGYADGRRPGQEEQHRLLLADMAESENSSRSCRFICAMSLYLDHERFYIVQETMEGFIVNDLLESRGNSGFGYDPIVIAAGDGRTVAELSPDEKNLISHRGKAARAIKKLLEAHLQ